MPVRVPPAPVPSDGFPVGLPVGFPVGLPVGFPVGLPVGLPVGFPVGLPVGFPVGLPVGLPVDDFVGVGDPDLLPVGLDVFDADEDAFVVGPRLAPVLPRAKLLVPDVAVGDELDVGSPVTAVWVGITEL